MNRELRKERMEECDWYWLSDNGPYRGCEGWSEREMNFASAANVRDFTTEAQNHKDRVETCRQSLLPVSVPLCSLVESRI